MTEHPLPSILDLAPMNEAFRDDPHVLLDDLRVRAPIHHDPLTGSTLLSRYEDIRALLEDRSLLRDPFRAEESAVMQRAMAAGQDPNLPRSSTTGMIMLDDPDHSRIRKPLAKALYARVAKVRPSAARIMERALDAVADEAEFDLMSRFCVPVPIEVIGFVLGVDRERLEQFRLWSEGIFHAFNPRRTPEQSEAMEAARIGLADYFRSAIAARRAGPRDDLISDMVQHQRECGTISDLELQLNLTSLLVAGNLTTTDLIGNAVRLLLTHPAELEKVKADPKRIPRAVEEVIRFESPVDMTSRILPKDLAVNGCPLHSGQSVFVSLRSANHDPEQFEDPHRFDVSRPLKPHVGFGGGAHVCIGAPLARVEAQLALAAIFARFPNIALADPDAPPAWRMLPFVRGLERLVVRTNL